MCCSSALRHQLSGCHGTADVLLPGDPHDQLMQFGVDIDLDVPPVADSWLAPGSFHVQMDSSCSAMCRSSWMRLLMPSNAVM